MRRPAILLVLAALAACKGSAPAQDKAAAGALAASPAATVPLAKASASAPVASARKETIENDLYTFAYSYPAAAAAIPALKVWLDSDLADEKATLIGEARQGRIAAKEMGFDYQPYDHSTEWALVADLADWLSLSARMSNYTGGAHPNYGYSALLWDKRGNRQVAAMALFSSKAALGAAIREPFCKELDRQRAEKRGEGGKLGTLDEFDACVDPLESTILLGSADKQHFTRIGVILDPYVAGPYVEGEYEVTLPVTAAVLKAVKPEYRAAFAAGR